MLFLDPWIQIWLMMIFCNSLHQCHPNHLEVHQYHHEMTWNNGILDNLSKEYLLLNGHNLLFNGGNLLLNGGSLPKDFLGKLDNILGIFYLFFNHFYFHFYCLQTYHLVNLK